MRMVSSVGAGKDCRGIRVKLGRIVTRLLNGLDETRS